MSERISVTPAKVQLIEADEAYSDVNGIIESATVELDPAARAVKITGDGRQEDGSIQGDLIASARGLKITCGQEGDLRKSLHLAFGERSELDELLDRLKQAGLPIVRALDDDPDIRLGEGSGSRRNDSGSGGGDTNEAADDRATVLQPSGEPVEGSPGK